MTILSGTGEYAFMSLHETVVLGLLKLPRNEWPLIAEAADVPLATIQKVAHGHTKNPRIQTVEKLAAVLKDRG